MYKIIKGANAIDAAQLMDTYARSTGAHPVWPSTRHAGGAAFVAVNKLPGVWVEAVKMVYVPADYADLPATYLALEAAVNAEEGFTPFGDHQGFGVDGETYVGQLVVKSHKVCK